MSLIVSNNSSSPSPLSVSQNIQASQIRYFKLAVDTLFLRMENNLADETKDNMFENEEHIIEKADQITEMYENLSISNEKKYELRQYILKEAGVFDSKFSATYDKIYIDNYLEFINISDFDDFEAEKIKSEDQYKVKKSKVVYESDSESESEDESVSMFSETQTDANSDDSDSSSSDSESESDDEYEPWVVKEKIKEVAVLTRENEVKDLKIKQLEALREQDNCIINQFIQNGDRASKLIDERDEQIIELRKTLEKKNKEIFYYESKVREMNEHTKLNNN